VQAAYHGMSIKDATIYTTFSPCLICTKMILNSGIKEVVYNSAYPPGEAARLLGKTSAEIQQDRFKAAQELQEKYKAVIILKGCGSLVCDGKTPIGVCDFGNPGMASGGMGDALTGIIVALLAQGLPLSEAAKLATCLHAAAADLAAKDGERGLIASDLMHHLRKLINP